MKVNHLEDLLFLKKNGLRSLFPQVPRIDVGLATCGRARGAEKIMEAIQQESQKEKGEVRIGQAGCLGFCGFEPMIHVTLPERPAVVYGPMTPLKAVQIVKDMKAERIRPEWALFKITNHSLKGRIEKGYGEIPSSSELPFFKDQIRLALGDCGIVHPLSVEEYCARGGYWALFKALKKMTPKMVLEEVIRSGIRGRGGAGFNVGTKWSVGRPPSGRRKICHLQCR